MSKYCASCGSVNEDGAMTCATCGAEFEKPNPVYQQNQGYNPQPQPYGQPYPQPQAYSVPMSAPYAPPTGIGGWIGWLILCSFFPVIGQLIMLTSKDPSAKNYAKAQLILMLIGVVLIVLFLSMGWLSLNEFNIN